MIRKTSQLLNMCTRWVLALCTKLKLILVLFIQQIATIDDGQEAETCGIVNTDNTICSTSDGESLNLKTGDKVPLRSMCYETDTDNRFLCLTNGIKLEETFSPQKGN